LLKQTAASQFPVRVATDYAEKRIGIACFVAGSISENEETAFNPNGTGCQLQVACPFEFPFTGDVD
jgi:hypothetical protein